MALTDNFDRADGDPGANWTDTQGAGASIATNELKGDSAANYAGTRYSGSSWNNNQSSQIVCGVDDYVGAAVRMSVGTNWYAYFNSGTVQECVGGITAEIAVWSDALPTVAIKCVATGTTLEGFLDAVSQGTVVDASLASGETGVMFYDTIGRANNWEGTGEVGGGGPPKQLLTMGIG